MIIIMMMENRKTMQHFGAKRRLIHTRNQKQTPYPGHEQPKDGGNENGNHQVIRTVATRTRGIEITTVDAVHKMTDENQYH